MREVSAGCVERGGPGDGAVHGLRVPGGVDVECRRDVVFLKYVGNRDMLNSLSLSIYLLYLVCVFV